MMRVCCACGHSFMAAGKNYRCSPCRSQYDKEWRERRKEAGRPVIPTKMPRDYHQAYEAAYYTDPENRLRRNALMRSYRAGPLRPHHEARSQVRRAIATGRIQRQPCEVCGAENADAHHDDYSRPLDVRWLCRPHHREFHAKAEGRQS